MTYETISVRMNRSDRNIKWGFSVRQQADGLVIDRIDAESLSDKAGVKHNDKVEQINGRSTRGMDANSANRLIDESFNEVRLSLQRFVTSHTCLPWTLSEKDNKMVVEEMKPGFGSGFGSFGGAPNHTPSNFAANSTTTRNTNQSHNHVHNFSTNAKTIPTHVLGRSDSSSNPPATNYTNVSASNYTKTPSTNYTNVSASNYTNAPPKNYISTPAAFGSAPTSYSYNNGVTSQAYGTGAGGTPLNELTFINTSSQDANAVGAVSPRNNAFYHSPSTRNRNDLSPGASIHHLQYNSPMNLYSSETAAEQYYQQTGKNPEGPIPRDKIPAYLTSEAKKLIEEEARGRFNRGKSPSSQSSCFKRISHAVGADN